MLTWRARLLHPPVPEGSVGSVRGRQLAARALDRRRAHDTPQTASARREVASEWFPRRLSKGPWGVECTLLAVIGTGGPVK
eukprot:1185207-Prorocentrum_minimum.AAC.5